MPQRPHRAAYAGQVGRLVGREVKEFEVRFCRMTLEQLTHATRSRLDDLVAGDDDAEGQDGDRAVSGGGRSHFTELKTDPGRRFWKVCWSR